MTINIGKLDRILRAGLGALLLIAVLVGPWPLMGSAVIAWIALIAGVVLLGTAAMRICPAYWILGMRTCER